MQTWLSGSVQMSHGKMTIVNQNRNRVLLCTTRDGFHAGSRLDCRGLSTRNGGREMTGGGLRRRQACCEGGIRMYLKSGKNCSFGTGKVRVKATWNVVPDDMSEAEVHAEAGKEFGAYVYDTYDERRGDERKSNGLTLTGSAPGQSPRDEEGRSMAGRKRPLKINIDLALVRLMINVAYIHKTI